MLKSQFGDFLQEAMDETPCFHRSGWGTKLPHATQCSKKKSCQINWQKHQLMNM